MQYSIAAGNPTRTLELAEAHLAEANLAEALVVDLMTADEFLHWAARAAADLTEQPGDGNIARSDAIARLNRVESLRGRSSRPASSPPRPATRPTPRWALYTAERAGATATGPLVGLWDRVAEATEQADMRHEHATTGRATVGPAGSSRHSVGGAQLPARHRHR
jgi:hypothetical protein